MTPNNLKHLLTNKITMSDIKQLEDEMWYEVMEDFVLTAELGHLAKNQMAHKEEIRQHYQKLIKFVQNKIDLAIAEERKRVVEIIEQNKIKDDLSYITGMFLSTQMNVNKTIDKIIKIITNNNETF